MVGIINLPQKTYIFSHQFCFLGVPEFDEFGGDIESIYTYEETKYMVGGRKGHANAREK